MRYALLFALCALSCAAEPVLLPDASTPDAGPCGGACGAGTVCSGGACVAVDAGSAVDVGPLDAGAVDVGEDRPAPVDLGTDVGAVDVGSDVPTDAGPMDVLPTGCASTTAGNCCGVACPAPPHGVAACLGGRCGVASCEANYGDCDGNAANGCETDTRATTAHCGACGAACATGRGCVASACVECASGTALCSGTCVNIATSVDNCGACGVRCQVLPNSNVSCVAGRCMNTCYSGRANCDGNHLSGCETDLMVSPTNCGRCGNVCPAGARTCTRGVCGP